LVGGLEFLRMPYPITFKIIRVPAPLWPRKSSRRPHALAPQKFSTIRRANESRAIAIFNLRYLR
jgi:hypothetical protein